MILRSARKLLMGLAPLLGLLAAFPGHCDAGEKVSTGHTQTDSAIVIVQRRSKKVKTCRAEVATVLNVMDQQMEIRDSAVFQTPGRMHLVKTLPGDVKQTVVSDGGILWIDDPEEKTVVRINLSRVYRATGREADAYQPDPTRPFRGIRWTTIRYVREEKLEDLRRLVFEAVPEVTLWHAELPVAPARVEFSINPRDGLLRTFTYLDTSGAAIISQVFSEVEVNPTLDPKQFDFVVPANSHIMDRTDSVVELLKAAEARVGRGGE
ncbi:MAG: hypothetical protein QGI83_24010 [Candidatus Latescibacteria bacterium]|nr:hypothetical protein [Candidatus Latescibacterota bacterium]